MDSERQMGYPSREEVFPSPEADNSCGSQDLWTILGMTKLCWISLRELSITLIARSCLMMFAMKQSGANTRRESQYSHLRAVPLPASSRKGLSVVLTRRGRCVKHYGLSWNSIDQLSYLSPSWNVPELHQHMSGVEPLRRLRLPREPVVVRRQRESVHHRRDLRD